MAMVIFGAKLASNLKLPKKEDFRFPGSKYDWILLNTSQTEDIRPKMPIGPQKNMISVSFCDEKIPNFELFSGIYARNSKKLQFGDISCNKYSKQTPSIISSYGETQANSNFSRKRHSKLTPQNWPKSEFFYATPI